MNGPFICRRWPKSVVQEIRQPEIIDPLELPQPMQAPINAPPFEQPLVAQLLPNIPPPQIPDIHEHPPQNTNAFTAFYRRFFPSSNPVTLNEIEMQRLFQQQNSPPVQRIFQPQPRPPPQPQVQPQPQPQPLPQPQVQTQPLYGPQAFLDDDIYIEGTIYDYIMKWIFCLLLVILNRVKKSKF